MTNKKIVIFGAGAVGCFVGGAWQDAGFNVAFLGREAIGAEVAEYGINVSDNLGYKAHINASDINFSIDPAILRDAELIILSVKNTGSEEAAEQINKFALKECPILVLQNGVSNADRLQELLPGREIIAGMIPYNIARLGKGRWHKGTPGLITARRTDLTLEISTSLVDYPIKLTVAEDMVPVMWGKLLLNLNNAVNGLSGRLLLDQLLQRGYRKVLAACIKETLQVLKAKGVKPAKVGIIAPYMMTTFFEAPDLIYHPMIRGKIDPKATSSMADDLNAGRPTEIDFLNQEVVNAGGEVGIPTPVNSKIIELIKSAEKGGRKDWSPEELMKEVLG